MKDLMIDLETFGKSYNAVVVQIGACYFDRITGEIGDTFIVNIDAERSMQCGFEMDASTVYWWLWQSKKARLSILEGNRSFVTDAITSFNDFAKKAKYIWSHATFDFVILMNYFNKMHIKPSFHYRSARDLRTLVDLAGITDFDKYRRVGVHHNALDDCVYQVQYAVDCLNILKIQ